MNEEVTKKATHYLLHSHISPLNEILHKVDLKTELQYHQDIENAYIAGYTQAVQEICDFIKANVYKYGKVVFKDNGASFEFRTDRFIEEIKQKLEVKSYYCFSFC